MAFDPRELVVLPGHPVVGWWPTGTVDEDTVVAYYGALAALEHGPTLHRYCDFSAVASFSFGYGGLEKLVGLRKAKLAEHREVLLVMMSTQPLGFGMARMYEALMANAGLRIHVCRSVDDAAWLLDVPEQLLDRPGSSR